MIKEGGFYLKPLSVRRSYGRASPRDAVALGRLIIWRLFKFIFF